MLIDLVCDIKIIEVGVFIGLRPIDPSRECQESAPKRTLICLMLGGVDKLVDVRLGG